MNEAAMAVLNFMGWLGITAFIVMIAWCLVATVGLTITRRWRD